MLREELREAFALWEQAVDVHHGAISAAHDDRGVLERGVRHANLAGLRARVSSALLRLIRTPEFNPEIKR